MGSVDFYTGVADKLGFTCRLVRKVLRQGQRVAVTGSADQLAQLDALLWRFEADEFVPHWRVRSGMALPALVSRTPVVLVDDWHDGGHGEVLINLGPAPVAAIDAFDRLLEVVATSPDEVQQGRLRWRAYINSGVKPGNHAAAPAS